MTTEATTDQARGPAEARQDADEQWAHCDGPRAATEVAGQEEAGATQKPVLILINPHSGRGKSMKIFRKQVEQILNAHHVTRDVFVTTRDVRAREFLDSKSLDQLMGYRAIVVLSGDGLLYETVNALMARDDRQQAMQIPIGLVPTGSGNGLAHTLINLTRANACKSHADAVKVCCEQAIRGQTCPSDLVRITHGAHGTSTTWSFLSIGWGLLADIDIDSEWLRSLGEFRFTLYGLLKALRASSRRGRLSYVLGPNHAQELRAQLANESNANASMYNASCEENTSRPLDSAPTTTTTSKNTTESTSTPNTDSHAEWIHIEDRFACLYAVHQPYVNSSTKFAPKSTPADRLTYLTYIRGRLSAYQALKFLLSIDDGSHEKLPFVRVVPVQAFKFQPLERARIVVDGETLAWDVSQGPLVAEVVPNMLKLAWSPLS